MCISASRPARRDQAHGLGVNLPELLVACTIGDEVFISAALQENIRTTFPGIVPALVSADPHETIRIGIVARTRGGGTYEPAALGELVVRNVGIDPWERGMDNRGTRVCRGEATCTGMTSFVPVEATAYACASMGNMGCCTGSGADTMRGL